MRAFADPTRKALADLVAFYGRVDEAQSGFSCPGRARCSRFAETGREPYLWRIEWLLVARRVAERGGRLPAERPDAGCRFLDAAGRCTVYEERPFGCRTYGCELAQNGGRGQRERLRSLNRELGDLALGFDPEDDGPRPISRHHSKGA